MLMKGRSKGGDMENVLESYGIAADGRDISKALMKALAERKEVTLLGGVFHTGPLMLPSGSRLEIAEDAVLQFIPDFSLYPPVFTRWEGVRCWAMHPCIYINEADDVTICGKGEINGSGKPWWDIVFDRRRLGVKEPQAEIEKYFASLNPDYRNQPGGGGGREYQFMRPPLIQIRSSRNVLIEGISLTDSPFWTVHPLFSEHVTIRGIHIKNPAEAPNTDGIDIESSSYVEVLDCIVDVGDDGIALKSGSGPDGIRDNIPTRHVHVKGCIVRSAHGGAVIGSETAAEISDFIAEDCFFDGTDRGIRIKSRRTRGGLIHDAVFRRIRMKDNLCPFVINMYYRCGTSDMSLFSLDPQTVDDGTPRLYNITIEDCHAEGSRASAGMVVGLPESPLGNLVIRNSSFAVADHPDRPIDESDMYNGLPDPPSRGFRIRNAEVTIENLVIKSDSPELIIEDGVTIRKES